MPASAEPGLAASATRGIAWQGSIGLLIRLLRSLVFLVLARLIVPEAFGVIALATVFTTVLRHLTGGGFSQALVRQVEVTKSHLDTAFYVSIALGATLSAGLAVLSAPISAWMDEPGLRQVLMGLSAMPLLAGLTSVPEGMLARRMAFRALSMRHLIAAVISTGAALVLALLGAGVWALVAQTLLEATVSCVVLWIATWRSYRPGLHISREAYKDLSSYGYKVVGHDLTHMVSSRADDFLIGAVLGTRALGVYSVAYRLLTILQDSLQGVAAGVAFPIYARIQEDASRLAQGFRRASQLNFAIAGPVFAFLATGAAPIVSLTLGSQWDRATPVVAALAISGIASSMLDMNSTLLNAKGEAGRVLSLSLLGAILNLIGFLAAVQYGIVWVAVAFATRAYLLLPLSIKMVARHVGGAMVVIGSYARITMMLIVPLLAGLSAHLLAPKVGDALSLLLAAIVGVPVYLLLLRLGARACFDDFALVVGRFLRRGQRV